jgi:hypothetical protein
MTQRWINRINIASVHKVVHRLWLSAARIIRSQRGSRFGWCPRRCTSSGCLPGSFGGRGSSGRIDDGKGHKTVPRTGMKRCTGRCAGRNKLVHIGWDGARHSDGAHDARSTSHCCDNQPSSFQAQAIHSFAGNRTHTVDFEKKVEGCHSRRWIERTKVDS